MTQEMIICFVVFVVMIGFVAKRAHKNERGLEPERVSKSRSLLYS